MPLSQSDWRESQLNQLRRTRPSHQTEDHTAWSHGWKFHWVRERDQPKRQTSRDWAPPNSLSLHQHIASASCVPQCPRRSTFLHATLPWKSTSRAQQQRQANKPGLVSRCALNPPQTWLRQPLSSELQDCRQSLSTGTVSRLASLHRRHYRRGGQSHESPYSP